MVEAGTTSAGNVCDITSPMGTPDLMDELSVLTSAIRFDDVSFMSKLAAGQSLDGAEIERVRQHLVEDAEQVAKFMDSLPNWNRQTLRPCAYRAGRRA